MPISVRGRYLKRSGRTNQRMSHEEIIQGMADGTDFSWDKYIVPDTTIDDLDAVLIERFINDARETAVPRILADNRDEPSVSYLTGNGRYATKNINDSKIKDVIIEEIFDRIKNHWPEFTVEYASNIIRSCYE